MPESDLSCPGPFGQSALNAYRAGYSPLPVRRDAGRDKSPCVKGYTGRSGRYPDERTVRQWVRLFPGANIALRLRPGMIGIDVDCYDGKQGAKTLRSLGRLPDTLISTSRRDGSGIRLYWMPEGFEAADFRGIAGPGVELITAWNRYAVVPPSVHLSGRRYRWVNKRIGIAELPRNVAELLLRQCGEVVPEAVSRAAGRSLRAAASGKPCSALRSATDLWCGRIEQAATAGGVHDAALRAVYALHGLDAAGHRGLASGLAEVRSVFCASTHRPSQRSAEWAGFMRAVPCAASAKAVPSDPCAELAGFSGPDGMPAERVARIKAQAAERRRKKYGPERAERTAHKPTRMEKLGG